MYHFLLNHMSPLLVIMRILLFICYEFKVIGTAPITMSPLGTVSVCPGGEVLLTCNRTSGSILYWTVSIPHLAMTRESIVPNQGALSTTDLLFDGLRFTQFNVTRTSETPFISQLLINNVTTEINGSTIHCSENGNENAVHVPMAVIHIINKDRFVTLSLMNQLLRNNNVTVIFQWPREAGAVYHVSVTPETPYTELTNTSHNSMINMTISYNIQYSVSIISCGVTTIHEILEYVTCDQPQQLLNHPVSVINGSQDNPHIEGQFIIYTCPPGFVLTGLNTSMCTGNGEWDPDPGMVTCIADCGVPIMNTSITLNYTYNYNSTLKGSVLILICDNDTTSADEQILHVTCHSNGSWIPDPAQFTCSSLTTISPGFNNEASGNTLLIVLILSGIILILLIILTLCTCTTKRLCMYKKTAQEDHNQQPMYEETTQYHEEILVEENAAYGHVICASKNS